VEGVGVGPYTGAAGVIGGNEHERTVGPWEGENRRGERIAFYGDGRVSIFGLIRTKIVLPISSGFHQYL
jgi:hypothetical protein